MKNNPVLNGKELNIDRCKWKLEKFGDIAIQQKESVDRDNSKLSKYVKGDHMKSEDIHLRTWGELTDEYLGPAFIRRFERGHILYGSRRTYLRKVTIAPFEGITSNTTFVIKANDELIDSRLLPFIMLSEGFSEHSIRNSKGSVNPYVNWKDIAHYEFLLPPKDQQAQLAELLWAMDEVIEKELEVLEKLEISLNSTIEEKIHGICLVGRTIQEVIDDLSDKMKVLPLECLGEFLKVRGIAKYEVIESGVPCIRYGELYTRHQRIVRKYYSFISNETALKGFRLKKNDILFAGSGETITEIGKSAAFISEDIAYAGSDTLIFRPNDIDGTYLGYLMNSQFVRQQLNKYGTGATVMHIYPTDLKKIKIPIRGKDNQIKIGEQLEELATNIRNVEININTSKSLQKSLINQIF
jgi:type I restriction enzyme, S subunit